jgi:hypothetical protein
VSPPASTAPARGLPALAWVGIVGGIVLIAVLVTLIALQLAVLTDSREHIRSQDAKITRLYDAARPALEDAAPAARKLLRDARPVVRQAGPFVHELRHGLRTLRASGPSLADAASAVPPLLHATTALADGALPLVRGLDAAGLPGVVGDADAVLGSLLYRGRLVRVLDATDAVLAEIQSQNLIARAARTPRLIRRLLRIQRTTLRVQTRTLRVQQESLAVQRTTRDYGRRAAEAAESIDRKTGGQVPPTPAVP